MVGQHLLAYGPRTALLVVDVQNDFADPSGALYVPGGGVVVDKANAEIAAARAAGAKVAYTQDWHPDATPHFVTDGGPWPVHCVRGSWGAAFHPDLSWPARSCRRAPAGEDGYSAFTVRHPQTGHEQPTRLVTVLRSTGVTAVVIVGLATDYCVLDSALDALRHGFHTVVLTEGTRPVDVQAGDGDRALERMAVAGAHIR